MIKPDQDRIHLRLLSRSDQDRRYAIYNGNIYVGGITVYPLDQETVTYGILIRQACRRQGYGKAAVCCLKEMLKPLGFTQIRARIEAGNQPSLAFHKSLEFIETGRESDKIRIFDCSLI